MRIQSLVGTGLLILNILLAALAAMMLEVVSVRLHGWLLLEPHRLKLVPVVGGVSIRVLGVITAAVWLRATAYLWLGVLATQKESVYFSTVMFTTPGQDDIILPQECRILSGMEAANGFLNFGLLSALFNGALRQVRLNQIEVVLRRVD